MKLTQFTTSVHVQTRASHISLPKALAQIDQIKKDTEIEQVRKDDVKLAVENLNDFLEPVTTNLKFVYHEDLNDYYVTVVDPLTNEVVREIPPKKMLDMYVAMAEYMGLLVDEKV